MSTTQRIYAAVLVSQVGNWLTFLAIGLILKEHYGGNHVAYAFLIQSLPALLLSRSLGALIPPQRVHAAFLLTQILLAIALVPLMATSSMIILYASLLISSCIKAVSTPLQTTLIGKWIPTALLSTVHSQVGAIQTATLAFAPALGGVISLRFGASALFLLDAISFLVAAVILWVPPQNSQDRERSVSPTPWVRPRIRDWFLSISPRPAQIPAPVLKALVPWFGFLVLGATLNGLEFAIFEELRLTPAQTGTLLAAWGSGALLAILASKPLKPFQNAWTWAGLHLLGLILFCWGGGFLSAGIGFVLSGLATSLLAGILRAKIQSSVPQGFNALPVWAYSNQILALINVVIYASLATFIQWVGTRGVSWGLCSGCLALLIQLRMIDVRERSTTLSHGAAT